MRCVNSNEESQPLLCCSQVTSEQVAAATDDTTCRVSALSLHQWRTSEDSDVAATSHGTARISEFSLCQDKLCQTREEEASADDVAPRSLTAASHNHKLCETSREVAATDNTARTLSSYQHNLWQQMKAEQRLQPVDLIQSQMMHQQGHSDRLILSIGGTLFETSSQTLCVDRNSMLAAYVLRHHNPGEILWFDRDGRRFEYVLNYLRNGTLWLEDVPTLRGVQEEAEFYGLSGLQTLCEERIRDVQKKAETIRKEQLEACSLTRLEIFRDIRNDSSLNREGSAPALSTGRTRTRDGPVPDTDTDRVFITGLDF